MPLASNTAAIQHDDLHSDKRYLMYPSVTTGLNRGYELELSAYTNYHMTAHLAHNIMSLPPLREQFGQHRLYLPSLNAGHHYNCLLTEGQWEAMVVGSPLKPQPVGQSYQPTTPAIMDKHQGQLEMMLKGLSVTVYQLGKHSPNPSYREECVAWWVSMVTGWLLDDVEGARCMLSLAQATALPEMALFVERFVTQAFNMDGGGMAVKNDLPLILNTLPLYMRQWLRRGLELGGWTPVFATATTTTKIFQKIQPNKLTPPSTYKAEGQPVARLYLLLSILHAAFSSPYGIPDLGRMAVMAKEGGERGPRCSPTS